MIQYNQQIEPEATHASVPEEIHPVAAAFGGDIGAALEKGGEEVSARIQSLATHMARMNYYRGKAQEADILTKYKTEAQNKTYGDPSDPNATVTTVNGKVIPSNLTFQPGQTPSDMAPQLTSEVPAALYKRQGYDASGALEDFDNWHHMTMDKYMEEASGLGLRNTTALRTQMDSAWASERNLIAKHESTELDKAQQQTFFKGMQLDADNASTKQDPISLGRTIESIQVTNKVLNDSQGKSADDPIRQLTEDKFVGKAINNSVNAVLRTSNDPTQAQTMVDRLHADGKINDTVYENATEHIDKSFKIMTEQNLRAQRIQQTNDRMSVLSGVVQGKLDLTNPNNLNEISEKDPEAGTAVENYNLNKTETIKVDDEAFASATKKMYELGSKEQVAKYALNVLNEGKLSQDRLNILFAAAIDRGKHLSDLEGDAAKHNPFQDLVDAGMKSIGLWNDKQPKQDGQTYSDYMDSIKQGKTPQEALQTATNASVIRKRPDLVSNPPTGTMMRDKYGNEAMVYPDGHYEETNGKKPKDSKK